MIYVRKHYSFLCLLTCNSLLLCSGGSPNHTIWTPSLSKPALPPGLTRPLGLVRTRPRPPPVGRRPARRRATASWRRRLRFQWCHRCAIHQPSASANSASRPGTARPTRRSTPRWRFSTCASSVSNTWSRRACYAGTWWVWRDLVFFKELCAGGKRVHLYFARRRRETVPCCFTLSSRLGFEKGPLCAQHDSLDSAPRAVSQAALARTRGGDRRGKSASGVLSAAEAEWWARSELSPCSCSLFLFTLHFPSFDAAFHLLLEVNNEKY